MTDYPIEPEIMIQNLSQIEAEVIQAVRALSFGSVRVIIEAGKPTRIIKEESVMLGKSTGRQE